MAARQPAQQRAVVPDPGIWVGPYRLLTRTDGKWIVYLDGCPPGEGTKSGPHGSKDVAERAAKKLVEASVPDPQAREWTTEETWVPRKPE